MLAVYFIMLAKNHFTLLASLAFFGLQLVCAQSSGSSLQLDADEPNINIISSPNLGGVDGSNRRGRGKSWMEFEVPLEFETRDNDEHFVEDVTVEWYVAIKDKNSNGTLLLEYAVDYVNIPTKEEISVSVYLTPTSLKILTGKDRYSESDIRATAAIISVDGREMKRVSTMRDENWWDSPSLIKDSKVELLPKDETPFKFHWWDQYGEIKSR